VSIFIDTEAVLREELVMKILVKRHLFIFAVIFCVTATAVTPALAGEQAGDPHDNGKAQSVVTQQCDRPQMYRGSRMGLEDRGHWMHNSMWHALKRLDLTETQKASIHQIRISMMKDMIQKRADLKIAKLELREQLRKDSVEMSAVESQVKKLEGLKTAMMLNVIKAREEIKSTLTPDQRKKLSELMHASGRDRSHMRPKG
jgi:Spy/CpxP family protein refolding chaperone